MDDDESCKFERLPGETAAEMACPRTTNDAVKQLQGGIVSKVKALLKADRSI